MNVLSKSILAVCSLAALGLGMATPDLAAAQNRAADAYQQAYDLVLDEQWSEAEDALRAFLTTHSRSDWGDDARFWLCYTQEQRGQDLEAAFACFQRFVKEHPQSSWVDDANSNMVRLGQQLTRSGKPEYESIVRSMQANSDEEVRLAALEALWQMGDERALEAIIELYDAGGSRSFKKKIVFVLSQFDAPRATEKLQEIALNDPDTGVRKDAAFWIVEEGGPEAIPFLERLARAHPNDVEVQKQIVFAYSELDEPGIPKLIEVARSHPIREVRKDAIFWLGEAGGPQVIDFFGELMQRTDDVEVQKQIVFAFSELDEAGVPHLIEVVRSHPNREVRKDAIFWLSDTGGPQVIDFFGELMRTTDDVEVQKQIVFAFSEMDEDGVPTLIEIAKTHPNREVRKDAIFWLGQSDDERARDALLEIVKGQ